MNEWTEARLGEIAEVLVGFAFKSKQFTSDPSDVRLLRGVNVSQGELDWGQTATLPAHLLHDHRYQLVAGDVVLAMDRPWIEAGLKRARIRSEDVPSLLVQRVARLRGTDRATTSFIHHLLATESFSAYLRNVVTGATVPHISQSQIEAFKLMLPPINVQRRIGDVLDAMDDLMINSRRRIEVLGEMARAIYREWFVHFRYPGHEDVPLVGSPLGPVPEGWRVVPLGEVALITMGQSPRSEFYNSEGMGKPFHQGVADFGSHYPTHRKFCTIDVRLAQEGDVLVSVRAPVGRINVADTSLVIGRGLAALRSIRGRQSLLLAGLREVFAVEDSMGGGTIFNAVGKKELEQVQMLLPPDPLADRADRLLQPKFELIRALTFANDRLGSIRDLLLPKLVTGQIDVSHLDLDALTETSVA